MLVVGIFLVVGGIYTPSGSTLPTCAPGPYPNPALPAGSSLTTSGGLIGYYTGGTFVPYTGYLSGLQIQNGLSYGCSSPGTSTTQTASSSVAPTTSSSAAVTTTTVTVSWTQSGSVTTTTLVAFDNVPPSSGGAIWTDAGLVLTTLGLVFTVPMALRRK
jgi:hypothetical protein